MAMSERTFNEEVVNQKPRIKEQDKALDELIPGLTQPNDQLSSKDISLSSQDLVELVMKYHELTQEQAEQALIDFGG